MATPNDSDDRPRCGRGCRIMREGIWALVRVAVRLLVEQMFDV